MLVEAKSDSQALLIPDDATLTPPRSDCAAYRRLQYRLKALSGPTRADVAERHILRRLLKGERPRFGDFRSVVSGSCAEVPSDPARLEAIEMASTIWHSVADLLNPPMNED